jgi:hypothetical protein
MVIVASIISLITCGNENVITGLGSQVDTSQPVVSIITDFGTGPGTYLTGKKRIYIDASDDMGVDTVTVVYSYYYLKDGVQYPMEIVVDAEWSEVDGCYVIDIDTLYGFYDEPTKSWLPMVDGPLTAVVIVSDKSGKRTVTPEIIYTVKNGPPKITMQIPRPRTRNSELLNEDPYPIVVSDSYFMGVFEDLAGLAPGYPLIKFWEDGTPEPFDYRGNAGWGNVSGYNSPGHGWIRPDEGVSESTRGEKGGSFRYYLRKRQSNGIPFADNTQNGLEAKKRYNLKIKAVDINGIPLEWPKDVYPNEPEYMTIFMEADGIPPIVTIIEPDQAKLYFRDNFKIIAEAEHQGDLSTEISELRFEVTGKDRKQVLLKKWEYPEIKDKSQGKFDIELEKTYYSLRQDDSAEMVDNESKVPAGAYSQVTFTDGSFTFSVIAVDDVGAKKTVPFSIYIDKQPPVTTVTSVNPYYTQDDIDKTKIEDNPNSYGNYRRWTVNKTVKIAVNSTDNRGDAIDSETNYAKFKYLLTSNDMQQSSAYSAWKGSDPTKTFERYLYEISGAKYFDEVRANPIPITSGTPNGNPLVKVEGKDGSYTLWLQTHKYNTSEKYKLWLYIVAMDNADNISYDKILLNVDQNTDKPRISYGNINDNGSTFMDDKYNIRLEIIDDNGLSDPAGSEKPLIEFRFAKDKDESDKMNANAGWHSIYNWQLEQPYGLSKDVLSVNINDWTLKKIAYNLLDQPYDAGNELNDQLKAQLGPEIEPKFIQIRATDNVKTKVYESDGAATGETGWQEFKMDLTYPEIHISTRDLDNTPLTGRDKTNPFVKPVKDRAYKDLDAIYGDIIEDNLSSITVKIDGDTANTITYTVQNIEKSKPSVFESGKFYIWENGKVTVNGKEKTILRWYIPKIFKTGDFTSSSFSNGSHTFEISFEDKVPQVTTASLTFYKDTIGPTISYLNPGSVGSLSFSEWNNLKDALNQNTPLTDIQKGIYKALEKKLIKDMSAQLSGTFNDDFSPIAVKDKNFFWYNIDNTGWTKKDIEISEDKTVGWEVPVTGLSDGVHILSLRVKDDLGNGSDKDTTGTGGSIENLAFMIDQSVPVFKDILPKDQITNKELKINGKITDTYGVKRLNVKLGNDEIAVIEYDELTDNFKQPVYSSVGGNTYGKNIKVTKNETLGKTFDFEVTIVPTGMDNGPKTLSFNATGSSGQATMTTINFTYDTKGPSVAIGAPLNKSVYTSNTDWDTLKNAVVIDDFGGVSANVNTIYNNVFDARIKDNEAVLPITFTDAASSINGIYWYKIDDDAWKSETITGAAEKQSVNVNLPMPAGGKWSDGVHRISIRAMDSLGNGYNVTDNTASPETGYGEGYQSNLVFMIDTGVPELTVKKENEIILSKTITKDFGTLKNSFEINGEIAGTFDIQELSVKIGSTVVASKAGGSGAAVISINPKSATSKKTYIFTGVIINPFDSLLGGAVTDGSKDGSFTVSVTVKGSSEQSDMKVSTFTLDTQGPKITVNAPIKEKIYLDSDQRGYIKAAIENNNTTAIAGMIFKDNITLKDKYYDLLRYNVKEKSSGLSGSFADTYSDIGVNFWYKFNDETLWRTGNTIFSNDNNKKSADWAVELPSTLQDGMNRLSIRVKDELSNGYGDTGAAPDNSGGNGYETNLNFILDTGTPKLETVTGLKEGNEPDVKGPSDEILVKGQITGTFMVKRLSVSIVSGSTIIITTDGNPALPVYGDPYIYDFNLTPVANTEKTFDYSFKVKTTNGGKELAYGSRSITVNAVGSSDNSDVKTLSFIYDNQGPTVNVSVPSIKLYMDDVKAAGLNNALEYGGFTPEQEEVYKKLDAMIITDASAKLSGTFNDEYSPIGNTFWWQIDNSGIWKDEPINASTNKSVGWEVPLDASLSEGVHLLSLRVQDSRGNGSIGGSTHDKDSGPGYETNLAFMIDKSAPEIPVINVPEKAVNGEFTVTGTVIKTFGVKKLSVKLANSEIAVYEKNSAGDYDLIKKPVDGINYVIDNGISINRGTGKSFNFTATIKPVSKIKTGEGLGDGPISLTFTAVGSSGQAGIGVDSFTFDNRGPAITVGAPINNIVYVSDSTLWSSLEPAVRLDEFGSVTSDVNKIYDELFDARIKDNKASFTVTFTDDFSNVFSAENNKYWYMFDGEGWQEATVPGTEFGKKSVSVKLPLPVSNSGSWTDSVHRLSVRVKDTLENGYDKDTLDTVISALGGNEKNNDYGHETYRAFMIDSGKPELTVTKTELGTFIASQQLSISGTITGTFKIQELNAKIGEYSRTFKPEDLKTILQSPAGKKRTYNFTDLPITNTTINNAIGNIEGSYTVSLTVQGSSELSDMKVSTFILDAKGPAISVNAPIKEKIYLNESGREMISTALENYKTDGLPVGVEKDFYTLLRNNVKDVSAGLSGSFTDTYSDIGTQYWYSFNGEDWTPKSTDVADAANKKSVDWKLNLTTQSDGKVLAPNGQVLPEGLNRLSIRVKDKWGNGFDNGSTVPEDKGDNGYETNILFILDTGTPVFSNVTGGLKEGNEPTVLGPLSTATVKGQISDTFMVKRLSVSIGSSADVILTTDGSQIKQEGEGDIYISSLSISPAADTSKTFNYQFDIDVNKSPKLQYGSRTITINAIGSSDNSAVKTLSFIYDDKGPNVSVSVPSNKVYMDDTVKTNLNTALLGGTLDTDQEALYNSLKPMLITDSSTKLSGTFNDEYSAVADETTNNTFWWQIDGGAWTNGTLAVSDNKSVGWEVPINGLGDGVHLLSLRAKDKWGNGYGDTPKDDSDVNTLVSANKNGGQGYETNIAFMIDKSVPILKITSAPDKPTNGAPTFTGKITNTYGVKRLSVKLGSDEIASIEEGQTGVGGITLNKTPGEGKSFDFTVTIDPSGLDDGPISLAFNAIGSSGQVAMVTSSFTRDTKGPTITLGAPISKSIYITNNQWLDLQPRVKNDDFDGILSENELKYDEIFNERIKDNSASLTVTFTDTASSVFAGENKYFWFRLDDNGWEKVSVEPDELGKQSVSKKLSLLKPNEKWPEGIHRLSIRAVDSLGNGSTDLIANDAKETGSAEGYQSNLVFMIDSEIPEPLFKIDDPSTGIINTSKSLVISGTIKNTFSVQELNVKIGSKVVAETNQISLVRTAGKKKEYSFDNIYIGSSEISKVTNDKEGSYTISLTVKGSSDQSGMMVNTFVLDTEGPKISINAPIKEKIYFEGNQLSDINNAIEQNTISALVPGTKKVFYDLLKYNVKDKSSGLSGSFADTYSDIMEGYWYSLDGGVTWKEGETIFSNTDNKKTADWQIPLTEMDNGVHQLSIRVKDKLSNGCDNGSNPVGNNGNGYETNIAFILDTGIPELDTSEFKENVVIGPSTDLYKVSGKIKGMFMVKRLSVALQPPAATFIEPPADGSTPIPVYNDSNIKNIKLTPAGKKTFDFSFDLDVTASELIKYGPNSITINAIGSSDQSDLKILPFIYDDKGPNVTLNAPITQKVYLTKDELDDLNSGTNLGTELTEKNNQLVDMIIRDASSGLNGYFNDDFSAVADAEHNTFWYKFLDDESPEWQPVEITNIKDKTVAWTIPLTVPGSSIYRKDGLYRVSIRVKDSLGNGCDNTTADNAITGNSGPGYETELAFMIDMGIPEFTKFKLVKDGKELPDTNIFLNGDFKITGTIRNTAKINKLTAKVGNETVNNAVITQKPNKEFDFEFSVSPAALNLGEKAHSITVTATGSSGQSSIEVSNFTYDITPPSANFNLPVAGIKKESGKFTNGEYSIWWSGSWETGEIKLGGVADDKFGVDKIYYHIGKMSGNVADGGDDASRIALYMNDDWWADTSLDVSTNAPKWSGGLYYWNYMDNLNPYQFATSLIEKGVDSATQHTPNMFYLPFYVKVVDRAGNINVVHYKVYVDPDKDIPSARIVSPSDNVRVGGEIRITGTANDNNWIHSVDIRIYDAVRKTYYKNPEDVWFEEGEGWIKANIAGNTDTTVSWYYSINADGLLNPDPGMQGRLVQVQVRAWDTKDMVYHDIPDVRSNPTLPYNYTFDSGVPTISVPKISKTGNVTRDYTDGIRVSGAFKVSATVQDDGGISSIRARLTGNQAFTEIVKDGAKTSAALALEPDWKVTVPPTVNQSSWEDGWRYYIINKGNISNWKDIDRDWTEGKTYENGTTIKYNGVAPIGSGASAMKADGPRANNDSNPDSVNWNSQFFKYAVEFEINSVNVTNLGYGKTGIFTLELDVYDNNKEPAPYSTRGTFNLGVDNYYPTAEITTQYNATTKKFFVMGTAIDTDEQSGSQQGLERMLIYFSRTDENGTKYYNARGIAAGTGDSYYNSSAYTGTNWAAGAGMMSYPNVRDMNNPSSIGNYRPTGDFDKFPLLKEINRVGRGNVWESPHAMVIDSHEVGEDSDTDGDGTYAEYWDGKGKVEWQALFDTTKFTDGPITVHYVIMDQAGNATHYEDEIYIGNKKPLIRSINLGTDINANGSVAPWANGAPGEYLANPFTIGETEKGNAEITTGFRVRNDRFGLRLDALFGNGTKHYRVSYVTREETEVQSTAMKRGTVYTIKTPGNTEWTKYGALNNNVGTTFVATGEARTKNSKGDDTIGTVYEYTYIGSSAEKTGVFGSDNYTEDDKQVDFTTAVFDDFTSMKDTNGKDYDADGKMILLHDKRFIVKVYDSTVSGGVEKNQLAHVALLNVDFDNDDIRAPIALINPFHWISAADNSLYLNSKDNGHIELEAQAGVRPKVSGQISIKGTISDNNIVGSLWANLENFTFGTGLQSESRGTVTYYRIANYNTTTYKLDGLDYWNSNGWKCTIIDSVNEQDGNSVSYQLDIDTNRHNNVAATNQALRIYAKDYNSKNTQNVPVSQTTDNAKTSMYQMDIVPYISNIVTRLTKAYNPNPSAFSRSAKGWYPVHEDEIITIEGFNLYSGSGDPSVDIRQTTGETAITQSNKLYTTGIRDPENNTDPHSKNKIYARVDADANNDSTNTIVSGFLVVRVNGIDSINNTNSAAADYNKEGNGMNNDTLTDDRAIYVWNTGYLSDEVESRLSSPFMRMDNKGTRFLSYGFYEGSETGRLKVIRNNTNIDAGLGRSNRILNTTIATGGSNNSWYAAGSDQSSNNNRGFQLGRSNPLGTLNGANNLAAMANDATTGYITLVSSMESSGSSRFKIPRIAVQPTSSATERTDGNADRIFMSYFDDKLKEVQVIYGNVGDANVGNLPHLPTRDTTTRPKTAEIVASDDLKHKGSMYTAAGFLKNGLPVVAWYDRLNQNLVFSYGSGTPTTKDYYSPTSSVVTETSNSNHIVYTYNNHGLKNGEIVLAGTAANPTTKYYAHVFDNNTFSLSETRNGTGVRVGTTNSIYFTTHIATPTATARNNTTVNNTWQWTFSAGHGLANNTQVYIVYNDTAVTALQYARTGSDGNSWKFASANGSTTGNQFYGGTAADNTSPDHNLLFVYVNGTSKQATYNTATRANTNTWQNNAVIVDIFKGTHVDMAVDGANNVHLAYYDLSNGGLWYALIPAIGTDDNARPNTSNIRPVKVDTYLSAGTKLMINIREEKGNYVPYISYAHVSFGETKNSIRVAWRTDFTNPGTAPAGSNEKDAFTGAWEVMTVPVSSNVTPNIDEFVCNGVPTGVGGWLVPATNRTTTYSTSGTSPLPTAPAATLRTYSNNYGGTIGNKTLANSIILSYMTDEWYEGAILKHYLY